VTTTPHQGNKAAAELTHERASAWQEAQNNHTVESGLNAVKSAGIINGGAIVALLALVGNIIDKDAAASVGAEQIGFTLLVFVAGLAASAFVSGFGYLTNFLYATASYYRTWDYIHPYIHETTKSRVFGGLGSVFHAFAVLLVTASYCLFLYGAYVSRDLVATTWANAQKAPQGTTPQ
jgi:hypothetical protein